MNSNIDIEVRALLQRRKGEWAAIAKEAAVSYSWITKFANGHIANPGYATLQRLHAQLRGKRALRGAAAPAKQAA